MITTMIRRSKTTGKKHRVSLLRSRLAKTNHRQFKHKKRTKAVKLKISRAVKKVLRTHRTTHGLRVRHH